MGDGPRPAFSPPGPRIFITPRRKLITAMKGGEHMPVEIKCTVTECEYNQNIKCDAPMIQVDRNHTQAANRSDETKCDTFKRKG